MVIQWQFDQPGQRAGIIGTLVAHNVGHGFTRFRAIVELQGTYGARSLYRKITILPLGNY
ncbi:MAG: hypothetical protein V3S58_04820 [Nitrosomonadaceae bacterium]